MEKSSSKFSVSYNVCIKEMYLILVVMAIKEKCLKSENDMSIKDNIYFRPEEVKVWFWCNGLVKHSYNIDILQFTIRKIKMLESTFDSFHNSYLKSCTSFTRII